MLISVCLSVSLPNPSLLFKIDKLFKKDISAKNAVLEKNDDQAGTSAPGEQAPPEDERQPVSSLHGKGPSHRTVVGTYHPPSPRPAGIALESVISDLPATG